MGTVVVGTEHSMERITVSHASHARHASHHDFDSVAATRRQNYGRPPAGPHAGGGLGGAEVGEQQRAPVCEEGGRLQRAHDQALAVDGLQAAGNAQAQAAGARGVRGEARGYGVVWCGVCGVAWCDMMWSYAAVLQCGAVVMYGVMVCAM